MADSRTFNYTIYSSDYPTNFIKYHIVIEGIEIIDKSDGEYMTHMNIGDSVKYSVYLDGYNFERPTEDEFESYDKGYRSNVSITASLYSGNIIKFEGTKNYINTIDFDYNNSNTYNLISTWGKSANNLNLLVYTYTNKYILNDIDGFATYNYPSNIDFIEQTYWSLRKNTIFDVNNSIWYESKYCPLWNSVNLYVDDPIIKSSATIVNSDNFTSSSNKTGYATSDNMINVQTVIDYVYPGYDYNIKFSLIDVDTNKVIATQNMNSKNIYNVSKEHTTYVGIFNLAANTVKSTTNLISSIEISLNGKVISTFKNTEDIIKLVVPEFTINAYTDSQNTNDRTLKIKKAGYIFTDFSVSDNIPRKYYTFKLSYINKSTGQLITNLATSGIYTYRTSTVPAHLYVRPTSTTFSSATDVFIKAEIYDSTNQSNLILLATFDNINNENQLIRIYEPKIINVVATVNNLKEAPTNQDNTFKVISTLSDISPYAQNILNISLINTDTKVVIPINGQNYISNTIEPPNLGENSYTVTFDLSAYHFTETTSVTVYVEFKEYGSPALVSYKHINDDTTVTFIKIDPEIVSTHAIPYSSNIVYVDDEIQMHDSVLLKNLTVGEDYTLQTTLMDKSTGLPLVGVSEVITIFTASDSSDSVITTVIIKMNESFSNKNVVFFEKLIYDNEVISSHEDINDGMQFAILPEVKVPTITGTVASYVSPYSNSEVYYGEDTITIQDVISMINLKPNSYYKLKGIVINKLTGEKLSENESFGNTNSFTMKFYIDLTTELSNKDIVVYEYLEIENKEVSKHEDINDTLQILTLPIIKPLPVWPEKPKPEPEFEGLIPIGQNNADKLDIEDDGDYTNIDLHRRIEEPSNVSDSEKQKGIFDFNYRLGIYNVNSYRTTEFVTHNENSEDSEIP